MIQAPLVFSLRSFLLLVAYLRPLSSCLATATKFFLIVRCDRQSEATVSVTVKEDVMSPVVEIAKRVKGEVLQSSGSRGQVDTKQSM